MKASNTNAAKTGVYFSILATGFLFVAEDSGAWGFDDEEPPMEEIVVVGQRPAARDPLLNRIIAEQFQEQWLNALRDELDRVHGELYAIDDQISVVEDRVEEACRNVQTIVNEATDSCTSVARTLNYICLASAGTLGGLSGVAPGVVAAVACEVGQDTALDACADNPDRWPDVIMDQIAAYCPDVD